jgi:hypothetical protein
VPDPNGETNTIPNDAATLAVVANTFTGFVEGLNNQESVGLVVDGTSGSVAFADYDSSHASSVIAGGGSDEGLDPADITQPATVSSVAFCLDSTRRDNVRAQLLDVHGDLLLQTGALRDGEIGFRSVDSFTGTAISNIHQVVMEGDTKRIWTIGHSGDATSIDFAFEGHELVPETSGQLSFLPVLACFFTLVRAGRGAH